MKNPKNINKRGGHITYGYVVLACCLMAGASLGLCFYCAGVFYEPVAAGLQLSVGQVSLCTTAMLVCMAVSALFVPVLMRMIPYKYLLALGTILAAGGTLGMAFCFSAAFLYLFAGIQGIGAALIGLVPATILLNRWFYSHSALWMGLCTAAPALAAALFSPLLGYALTGLGWRMALVVQAVLLVGMLLPALLLPFTASPEQMGLTPYGIRDLIPEQTRKKLKSPFSTFVCIACLSMLAASLLGISQHFSAFGTSLGKELVFGAGLFSWCMIGSVLMKLFGGFLADKIGAGLATALLDLVLLLATIGMWISMAVPNDLALKILAFFFGCAYALNDFSVPLLVKSQFGPARYAKIYSFMNFLSTVTIALSIALVGALYDSTGSFGWIWAAALVVEVLILVFTYLLIRSERRTIALANAVRSVMPVHVPDSLQKALPPTRAEEADEYEPEPQWEQESAAPSGILHPVDEVVDAEFSESAPAGPESSRPKEGQEIIDLVYEPAPVETADLDASTEQAGQKSFCCK